MARWAENPMAQLRRVDIRDKDLHGLKYFRLVGPLLERLQSDATARDKAGNRQLFFDQYAGLLLLTFFSPIVTSLRALQQASGLAKVQKLLGCHSDKRQRPGDRRTARHTSGGSSVRRG